jgi:GH24 family phage-related lysozyme (muramidase)
MRYRLLTAEQYARRLRLLLAGSGVLHRRVQSAGGRALIGWGYSLLRGNNTAIWRDAGIDLTAEGWACLRRIDEAAPGERLALALTFDKVLTEAEANRLLVAATREHEVHANRLGLPRCDERLAIVSLTFSRGTLTLTESHPLMVALAEGDRPEAWFQLRYNCWGKAADLEAGLRKRRLMEATVFGLYDDPANVSVDEARRVLDMVERHRHVINQVEQRFGQTLAGIEAQRNLVAQANRDYPGIVSTWGEVPTIREALAPAYQALHAAGQPLDGQAPASPAANRDDLRQPPRLA